MARRTSQLQAHPVTEAPVEPPVEAPVEAPVQAPVQAPAEPGANARRFQRLADGVKSLRVGGGTLNLGERTLMILGGIIAPLGLALVLIGWYGAAHTPNLYEQIPYLVSGGLFGLGLVFIGSFFYFAHWITELVKEGRGQSAAMIEAIARLEETVRQQAGADRAAAAAANTNGSGPAPDRALVATAKGTMAHRPDCVLVTGKSGVRHVGEADSLEPCKLCDPYASGDGAVDAEAADLLG
jgi:hypothetical protein